MAISKNRLLGWLFLTLFIRGCCSLAYSSSSKTNHHSSKVNALSKAFRLLYNQGGTLHVLENCKGMEDYDAATLMQAALRASTSSRLASLDKGMASGIINALLGYACQTESSQRAVDLMTVYTDLQELRPDLVSLCLAYTATYKDHPIQSTNYLAVAENQFGSTEDNIRPRSSHSKSLRVPLNHPKGVQVLKETADWIAVAKPSGMLCYNRLEDSNKEVSVQDSLLQSGITLSSFQQDGIVHRLDRGTSGCMVLAKTNPMHAILVSQFFLRNLDKSYQALVWTDDKNCVLQQERTTVRYPMDGRPAMSTVSLQNKISCQISRIQVQTRQGRRHQVRIHCAQGLGAPILVDPLYGGGGIRVLKVFRSQPHVASTLKRFHKEKSFCLHADQLVIPVVDLKVEAPLPDAWMELEDAIGQTIQ